MATITIAEGPFRRHVPTACVGASGDDKIVEEGTGTFGATDDDAELALSYIGKVTNWHFEWVATTGSTTTVTPVAVADGVPQTDGVITSGAITVGREGHTAGAVSFKYKIEGYAKNTAA